jgi:hypothetical protein
VQRLLAAIMFAAASSRLIEADEAAALSAMRDCWNAEEDL